MLKGMNILEIHEAKVVKDIKNKQLDFVHWQFSVPSSFKSFLEPYYIPMVCIDSTLYEHLR